MGHKAKVMIAAGAAAPPFELELLTGRPRSLQQILSSGPALLAFFKVSCPVCQLTLPYLERLASTSTLQIIGISQDAAATTQAFADRYGLTLPLLLDPSNDGYPASNAYGISSVPTQFLVEPDGRIAASFTGFSRQDLEALGARAGVAIFHADDHVPEWKAG